MNGQELSRATSISNEDAEDIFTYHEWDDAKKASSKLVRDSLRDAFKTIINNVPPSADRSAALRKLREARMDCNSALTFEGRL